MRSIFSLYVVFFALSAIAQSQTFRSNVQVGVNFNANITNLLPLKREVHNTVRPGVGLDLTKSFGDKFKANAFGGYSFRSSRDESKIRSLDLHFLDAGLLGQISLGSGVFLEIGGRYAYRFLSVLSGPTEVDAGSTVVGRYVYYPDQLDALLGIELKMNDYADIRLRSNVPLHAFYRPDKNGIPGKPRFYEVQISLSVKLNKLSNKQHFKKANNLAEALADPLQVKSLSLHRENLDSLPPGIGELLNLEELFLDGNNLKELPDEICNLVNLRILSVRYNDLSSLPQEFGKLISLEELRLNNNNLKQLPASFYSLPRLQFLYLGKNSLELLQPELGNLKTLVEMDVANSGALLRIPTEIIKIRNLEKLYLDSSTILPDGIESQIPKLQIIKRD